MAQYTFVEKTNIDNEKMLVGGAIVNGLGMTGGGVGAGSMRYAVPTGLVLSASLFTENSMYGGSGVNVAVVSDSLFDSLFGLAAYKVVAPRRNKTVKKRHALYIE
jgi:hypothetical protein